MEKLDEEIGREVSEKASYFEYRSHAGLSLAEYISAFNTPCSRFKLPLSWKTHIELLAAARIARSEVFAGMTALSQYQVPPSWQILLNYLFQVGVLASPHFQQRMFSNDLPKQYALSFACKFDSRLTDGREVAFGGLGHSFDFEESLSKGIGEALERYFLTLYKKNSLVRGSCDSLRAKNRNILSLPDLNGYLPWQIEAQKHALARGEGAEFHWVEGIELLSKQRSYIPAQLVFWNYDLTESREPRLMDITTNGGAGHFSVEEAILSALYELVQRDGFLIFWLNSLTPPVLDVASIDDPDIERMLEQFERYRLRAVFLDTTSDIEVPSCTCVVIDERGKEPTITLSAGTGFDPVKAILASAHEALVIQTSISFREKYVLPNDYQSFSNSAAIGKAQRVSMWQGTAMLEKFNFFISGHHPLLAETRYMKAARKFGSVQAELGAVRDMFRKKGRGYQVYYHAVRHPVLAAVGYHVVKVIVPQLMPLYLTEHRATLDAIRLREVPQLLGYTATSLNPLPHPFP